MVLEQTLISLVSNMTESMTYCGESGLLSDINQKQLGWVTRYSLVYSNPINGGKELLRVCT